MTTPLWILAAGSAVVGYIGLPAVIAHGEWNWIHHYLGADYGGPVAEAAVEGHVSLGLEWGLIALSSAIAIGTFFYARSVYLAHGVAFDATLAQQFGGLYQTWKDKYYWDDFYDNVVVDSLIGGLAERGLAPFDGKVVDGIVNGVASAAQVASGLLRRLQTGIVQNYALALVVGVVLVIGLMVFGG